MSVPFHAASGLVIVRTAIWGPRRTDVLRMVLDTGSSGTLINRDCLVAVGYQPSSSLKRVQITTASGVTSAPRLSVTRITSLDFDRFDFPVVAHVFPPKFRFDGLLGLDFLRGTFLTMDFRRGELELT